MTSTRPYTDSILGPLTPWSMKVGDVICDICGKKLVPDVKLGDLHEAATWWIECAGYTHSKNTKHRQYTLKLIPIIEQKLKEMGGF